MPPLSIPGSERELLTWAIPLSRARPPTSARSLSLRLRSGVGGRVRGPKAGLTRPTFHKNRSRTLDGAMSSWINSGGAGSRRRRLHHPKCQTSQGKISTADSGHNRPPAMQKKMTARPFASRPGQPRLR